MSHKRRPQAHQNAGYHACHNAFLRDGTSGSGQIAIGLAVQDHRNESARYTQGKEHSISLGLKRVAQNHPHDQGDADRNGERNGESSHINRSHEQEIGEVEQNSADQSVNNVRGICRVDVVHKT
jgi:hypothetical protein